jgi:hypothetical protein
MRSATTAGNLSVCSTNSRGAGSSSGAATRQDDPAVPAAVGSESDQAVAEPELVAALLRHVDHLGLGRRAFSALELIRAAEVLDQLARHVRLSGVTVIGEPAAVSGVELPGRTLSKVREDLAGAAEDPTVLDLQHRSQIAPGGVPKALALIGPRFDLTRDVVDPELGQHLPDSRGERAPLRLPEDRQRVSH